jgi:hypothetical protein
MVENGGNRFIKLSVVFPPKRLLARAYGSIHWCVVVERCGKSVKLPGMFSYTLRTARDYYKCFYCGGPITPGTLYVEERFPGVTRRYHVTCISKTVTRIVFKDTPGGGVLCTY